MLDRALVYDLEIIRAIPDRNEARIEGIEYCAGWGDHANMGISVLCAYDYAEQRYRVFCADNLKEFAALCASRYPLVGFNNLDFDNRVLAAAGVMIEPDCCYDILGEIWRALGRRVRGYRLDDCAPAALGPSAVKSGDGALAPVLWQQSNAGTVIDYCLNDVRLTKGLFDRVIEDGGITDPHTMGLLRLRQPEGVSLIA